jgi:catechol 2,3-dioxygenase-like lactoylglutathione lyase family enzyme
MDRLIAFYERVFGARVTVDLEEEGLRHAFIEVGPHTVLHPFQVPGRRAAGPPADVRARPPGPLRAERGERGGVPEILRRVVAEGAGDGAVTDMGSLLSAGFTDPDGGEHEVVWVKPGLPWRPG